MLKLKTASCRGKAFFAFFAAFFAVLLLYILNGTAPFGDNTLLVSDAYGQYASFWAYYHDVLHGTADPIYSLEKTMGGNMTGLFAYYLASPFNLIFALFPKQRIPEALHLIIALKLGCCALTSAVYLDRSKKTDLPQTLLLSFSYALCAYNVGFCWSVMWLDGVLLLPLVALGIEKLARGDRALTYILSLATAIVTSFYIGFMLCIFSVLYWLCMCVRDGRSLKSFRVFAVSSLSAGALSAFMVLPAMLAMTGGKKQPMSALLFEEIQTRASRFSAYFVSPSGERAIRVAMVLVPAAALAPTAAAAALAAKKKLGRRAVMCIAAVAAAAFLCYNIALNNYIPLRLLCGTTTIGQIKNGSPAIFCGAVPTALAAVYFVSPGTPRRKKLADALMLAVVYISFGSLTLNMVWHGFTENHSFNYRYSFIFSFLIISAAADALSEKRTLSPKRSAVALSVAIGAALLLLALRPSYIDAAAAAAGLLLYAGTIYFCYMPQSKTVVDSITRLCGKVSGALRKGKRAAGPSAAAVISILLLAAGTVEIMANADMTFDSMRTMYDHKASDFRRDVSALVSAADELETRDGSLYRVDIDGLYMGVNAPMTGGYNGLSHFSSTEKTETIDFLRGAGVASYQNIWASADIGVTDTAEALLGVKYTLRGDGGTLYAEENADAFPLAFLCGSHAADAPSDSDIRALRADSVCRVLFASDSDVFAPADFTVSASDNVCSFSDAGGAVYRQQSEVSPARLTLTADIVSDSELYLSTGADGSNTVTLTSGTDVSGTDISLAAAVSLGSFEPGETASVVVAFSGGELYADDIALFYENDRRMSDYAALANGSACEISSKTDSRLEISALCPEECCLVLTVPYDEGWRAYIDGERADTARAAGFFLCVPLGAGSHTVRLVYRAPGMAAGIAISLTAAALLYIYGGKKRIFEIF